jgi:very-long-chain (3R)-3-hydroxyacyl-CoA dehydratase
MSSKTTTTTTPVTKVKKEKNFLITLYLIIYNFAMCGGWGYLLYLTIMNYVEGKGPEKVLETIYSPLKIFQTGAILEIFHALFGFVASPVGTAVMQVASRLFVLYFGLGLPTPFKDSESWVITTLLVSWSVTEVIRYSFYALNEMKLQPYFLLYLRYTTFIVLYITGVASELIVLYFRLPYIKEHRPYSYFMPNEYNWAFDTYYLTLLAFVSYIPGFPQLYGYMWKQRAIKIGGADKQKTK